MTDLTINMDSSSSFSFSSGCGRIEEYCAKRLKIKLNSEFLLSGIKYYTLSFEPFSLSRKIITENIYRNSTSTEGIYFSNGYIYCPIYDYIAAAPSVMVQVDGYETDEDGNVSAIIKSGIFTLQFSPSLTGEGVMLQTVRPDVKFKENVENAVTEILDTKEIDGARLKKFSVDANRLKLSSISMAQLQDNCVTSTKIAKNAVSAQNIEDLCITGEKIADKTIGGEKLKDGSISADKICDKNISGAKIADNSKLEEAGRYAEKLGFTGIGLDSKYQKFIHVDTRKSKSFFRYRSDGSTYSVKTFFETVKPGSKGDSVKLLQEKLSNLGFRGADNKKLICDGVFGKNTDFALKNFQKSKGLVADGIAGPKTWAEL